MNQFDTSEFEQEQFESRESDRAHFEAELTLALQHVDPPAGFADRVLAKAAEHGNEVSRAQVLTMPRRVQAWVGGAIAAALLVGALGIQQQHERRKRAEEAAQAQQQLELALQITGQTLANVRAQVQEAGIRLGD